MTKFHFYGSSVAEWKTSDNIQDVINYLKPAKLPFSLWLVPLPDDAPYEINFYQPKVEGIVYLGTYKSSKLWNQFSK